MPCRMETMLQADMQSMMSCLKMHRVHLGFLGNNDARILSMMHSQISQVTHCI